MSRFSNRIKTSEDDESTLELDGLESIDNEDLDDDIMGKKKISKVPKRINKNSKMKESEKQSEKFEESEKSGESDSNNKKLVILGVLILIIAIIIAMYFILGKNGESPVDEVIQEPNQNQQEDTMPMTETSESQLSNEEMAQQDLADKGFGLETTKTNDSTEITSLAKIKDFFGNVINEDYQVESVVTTTDGVSYKKYRSITDDGVELYYLMGKYQGKDCIITIPYSHFMELTSEGVIICEIEILKTTEGNYIVSYMRPIKDPKITMPK